MGKHITEFKRKHADDVPEVFILLISFFQVYPYHLKTEGLFRKAAQATKLDELQMHMSMGNYYYLTKLKDDPHVVSNYLKKVLKYMGEPLCTFKLYTAFRDLSGNLKSC